MFCDWPTPAVQLLSPCFVLGSACRTVLSPCFVLGSRLLFAACAPNRTACGMFRSCSAVGRDRHSCVLGCRAVIELGWFTSGLRVSLWRSRQRTKETERTRGTRERNRRRGRVRFCVNILALSCFPRGVRWGSAPQTCAKESSTLWTLFTLRRGWVGADSRRHPGTIGDLTGSNLWPGRSCNVARQQVEAAQRPLWTLFIWVVMWVRFTRRSRVRFTRALPVITGR